MLLATTSIPAGAQTLPIPSESEVPAPTVGQLCGEQGTSDFAGRMDRAVETGGLDPSIAAEFEEWIRTGCAAIRPRDMDSAYDEFFSEGSSRVERSIQAARARFTLTRPWEYGRSAYQQAALTNPSIDQDIARLAHIIAFYGLHADAATVTDLLNVHVATDRTAWSAQGPTVEQPHLTDEGPYRGAGPR